MKIMNYKDGIRLYELMKNKGYNIRKIVFDKVTLIFKWTLFRHL